MLALGFVAFALDVGVLFRTKGTTRPAAKVRQWLRRKGPKTAQTTNEQAVANAAAKCTASTRRWGPNPATVTLTVPTTGNFTGSHG